jgi:hypothetical protein
VNFVFLTSLKDGVKVFQMFGILFGSIYEILLIGKDEVGEIMEYLCHGMVESVSYIF